VKGRKGSGALWLVVATVALIPPIAGYAATTAQWDTNSAPGIQGGSGVWNTSLPNWDKGGGVRGAWINSAGDTAVFSGTPGGTVQLSSAITAGLLEFDAAGYTITQSQSFALTLSSGSVVANADGIIAAAISTPAGFFKSGAGMLTLSGSNTIRGPVTISGGTLSFTNEANLGSTANDVALSGGVLRYAGATPLSLASGRTVIVDAGGGGGGIETTGGMLQLASTGQLTGAGTLNKLGAQTLIISGANTAFSGAVQVSNGTLQLNNANAINGRPVSLAGGRLSLRADQSADFRSDISASAGANATLDVDRASGFGRSDSVFGAGSLAVAMGATLAVNGGSRWVLGVQDLQVDGALHVNDLGVLVRGALAGTGSVTFGAITQPPDGLTRGLIITGGGAPRTLAADLVADATTGGSPIVGAIEGSSLVYGGTWTGNASADTVQNWVLLRDGASFLLAAAARVNTVLSDLSASRPFIVEGNGTNNSFEMDGGFVADHTAPGSANAEGLASLEIRNATLVSRSGASLPLVTATESRSGGLTFGGTSGAAWRVADSDQQYAGRVTFNTSTTLQLDKDLTHVGTVESRFDGQFEIPIAGVIVTKMGPGWLNLMGSQGYAPGSALWVQGGGVRFGTDPGAGWYAGNYTRGADGSITVPPAPKGTLAVAVGGTSGGTAEFAAPVSRVASLAISAGGLVRLVPGDRTLATEALMIDGGGQLDLADGRLVVDYASDAGSPLANIAQWIKNGYNASGTRWQGPGIVSSAAAAEPDRLGVGYAEAADVLSLSGGQTGVFGGQTVDATSVLARVTLLGDANLDGRVSLADFQRLELAYGTSGRSWADGDFDYDGAVGLPDFQALYRNFDPNESAEARAAVEAFAGSVPEPLSGAWICVGVGLLRTRRVRRRKR
jgi:autotransporter-associated beta strand protein